ncbi:MAG: hydroxyacylglutathione hydrolase, partial [Inhella sp.]
DAAPLEARLATLGLPLRTILVTHHHGDHTGGLQRLAARYPDCEIVGPAGEAIAGLQRGLSGGDTLHALGQQIRVLDVPGHTAGHIAYVIDAPSDGGAALLFCGDTLFAAGCGRLFEGSPAQMLASLKTLAALPPTTRVCCTHEYTLANLRFARALEPDNATLAAREALERAKRDAGQPTLPSSMALEMATNPFLRCTAPALRAAAARAPQPASDGSELAVFTALRAWKNQF